MDQIENPASKLSERSTNILAGDHKQIIIYLAKQALTVETSNVLIKVRKPKLRFFLQSANVLNNDNKLCVDFITDWRRLKSQLAI